MLFRPARFAPLLTITTLSGTGFVDGVDAPPVGIAMCHCGES